MESNTKSSSKSYQEEANGGLQNSQALGNPPSCSKSGKGSPIPQSVREKDTLTTQQCIMESWPDQTPDIQRASAEQVAQVQGILTNLGYQTRTPPPGFHNPPILSTGNISCTVSQLESGGLLQSPTAGIMQWQDQDIPMGTEMSVNTEQVIESQDIILLYIIARWRTI